MGRMGLAVCLSSNKEHKGNQNLVEPRECSVGCCFSELGSAPL